MIHFCSKRLNCGMADREFVIRTASSCRASCRSRVLRASDVEPTFYTDKQPVTSAQLGYTVSFTLENTEDRFKNTDNTQTKQTQRRKSKQHKTQQNKTSLV